MKILYYLTAHGYGHGVRAGAIVNSFSSDVHVTFRTNLPYEFFREEVCKEFSYYQGAFDCGCLQSDGVTVEILGTLQTYASVEKRNESALEKEVAWCKKNDIDAIISDITPFAFEVADNAGIPSFAVSNFTWYDVYKEYVSEYPDFSPMLSRMKSQYESADIVFALEPACPMDYFKARTEIPIVGRRGNNIRSTVAEKIGIDKRKKIGLIYVGDFGMSSALWSKLKDFDQWEFLGVQHIPGSPENYHLIKKSDFRYQDLSASVDVMISKVGYGAVSECLLNGTPIIYLPREKFAEYPYIENLIDRWGYGFRLLREDFYNLDWGEPLELSLKNGRPAPYKTYGTAICAEAIETYIVKELHR